VNIALQRGLIAFDGELVSGLLPDDIRRQGALSQ
jgi:hypothetical protein